jgi:hypothetical protein
MTDHDVHDGNTQTLSGVGPNTGLEIDRHQSGTGEQTYVAGENVDGQVAFGEACVAFVQDYRGGR